MATSVSASDLLSTYATFNAVDFKSFIINRLGLSDNPILRDADRLGSNLNAVIDILAVMLQQLQFNLSLTSSEATFSSATLYESMSKLVSLLGYKSSGKQTSMLPITITCDCSTLDTNAVGDTQVMIPRFLVVNHNASYSLSNNIVTVLKNGKQEVTVDAVLHQGIIQESPVYTALGDEFETVTINDTYIRNGESFISDNFFAVFVREPNSTWEEWTETTSIFIENADATKYEKRFTEGYNYEFKFGNGTYGKKLAPGTEIVIYYIISIGEAGKIGTGKIAGKVPGVYTSPMYTKIMNDISKTNTISSVINPEYISISSTGPSTDISYPESVENIRANAPRIFSSQNKLLTLDDYKSFIMNRFTSYCKDVVMMDNNTYTSRYLRYYYDMGCEAPQKDSRVNIAQVEFMTACNFNNVYAFIVPAVNTIISNRIPNYLNTSLKQDIVNKIDEYKCVTHNLVPIDPVYRAFTWGSQYLSYDYYNPDQLKTKLVVKRKRTSHYSADYIKNIIISNLKTYFDSLRLGSPIDINVITEAIKLAPGIDTIFIEDMNGNQNSKISIYAWNPLYSSADCGLSLQTILNDTFIYPYFYDLDNISNLIEIRTEE